MYNEGIIVKKRDDNTISISIKVGDNVVISKILTTFDVEQLLFQLQEVLKDGGK